MKRKTGPNGWGWSAEYVMFAAAASNTGGSHMTITQSGTVSFKIVATLGMALLMAILSACEILATEGARDAIAGGREIREFEDRELSPIRTRWMISG